MKNKCYVYAYLRPDRQSPYYIGMGQGQRVNNTHINVPVPPHDRREIIKEGLTRKEALDLEALLVKQWGRICKNDGVLLNKSHGFRAGGALMGNQHAKGVRYDKNADWFVKVSKKRAKMRHWNDGVKNYFRATCPPGCVPGRLGGWTRNNNGVKNSRAKKWQLTFTDGRVIIITALREWCNSQPDINYDGLYYAFQHKTNYKNIIQEVIQL